MVYTPSSHHLTAQVADNAWVTERLESVHFLRHEGVRGREKVKEKGGEKGREKKERTKNGKKGERQKVRSVKRGL